jgi:hypothetical protein
LVRFSVGLQGGLRAGRVLHGRGLSLIFFLKKHGRNLSLAHGLASPRVRRVLTPNLVARSGLTDRIRPGRVVKTLP